MAKSTQKEEELNELQEKPSIPQEKEEEVRPEMDLTKSHKERIVLFVQSRKTVNYIRIDGFLKALFPPRINEKPGFNNQGNMKTLRNDLRELQKERKLVFSNNNFDRLGSHYYETGNPVTKYHDVTTLPIEARLP